MEVILLKDVLGLGMEGDIVKAKDGYARNYLIPRKLAMLPTPAAVKGLETKKKRTAAEAEKENRKLRDIAKKLSETSLTIIMESGANDMLFGSVTSEAISQALKKENLNVDKKNIILGEPIKKLGIYNVEAKLHPEIKTNLRIWVVKK